MEPEITEEEAPATPRDHVKFVANMVIGSSVGSVIKTLIRQNMVPKNNLQKVELFIASLALGGLVAKQTTASTDQAIDKYADMFLKAKQKASSDLPPQTPETPE